MKLLVLERKPLRSSLRLCLGTVGILTLLQLLIELYVGWHQNPSVFGTDWGVVVGGRGRRWEVRGGEMRQGQRHERWGKWTEMNFGNHRQKRISAILATEWANLIIGPDTVSTWLNAFYKIQIICQLSMVIIFNFQMLLNSVQCHTTVIVIISKDQNLFR